MSSRRIGLLALILVAIAAFFALGLNRYLDLAYLQAQHQALVDRYQAYPVQTGLSYVLIYVTGAALSLPVAGIMTLLAGAIFGLWWGSLLAIVAATAGASAGFLIARFVLREAVQQRLGERLTTLNQGFERDGAYYLFSIRLVPLFPFFIVNLLMGLTPIRLHAFAVATLLGMLPVTMIFVNAGTQLAKIENLQQIISLPILLSLLLIAVFPVVIHKALNVANSRRRARARLSETEEV